MSGGDATGVLSYLVECLSLAPNPKAVLSPLTQWRHRLRDLQAVALSMAVTLAPSTARCVERRTNRNPRSRP